MHMRQLSRNQAFTLAETLVVVTVIVLLLSVLLPSLRFARESARISVCASNLHQLGVMILTYATDHNGDLPPYPATATKPQRIHQDVAPILLNDYGASVDVFYCPSQRQSIEYPPGSGNIRPLADTATHEWCFFTDEFGVNPFITYMILMNVPFVSASESPRRLYQDGEDLPLFADFLMDVPSISGYIVNHTSPPGGATFSDPRGGHKLFIEGHVEWIEWDEVIWRYDGGGEGVYW